LCKKGKREKGKNGKEEFSKKLPFPLFPLSLFPFPYTNFIPFSEGLPKIFVAPTPYRITTYNTNFKIPQEFSCIWATSSAITKETEYYT
jgi:hypothetical protein